MIYFFSRDHEVLQCEIYPGTPHVLTVIKADGVQQTERHDSSDRLHARWRQVIHQLTMEGWVGPLGRDTRS